MTRLKSVTQERDLDAFLNTAQLAGTEFTAGLVSSHQLILCNNQSRPTQNDEMSRSYKLRLVPHITHIYLPIRRKKRQLRNTKQTKTD